MADILGELFATRGYGRLHALKELEELRARVRGFDPYAFSFKVSDVLRTYATRQFRLQATSQTSPAVL